MTDVNARIAELEAQVASLKADVVAEEAATSRRGLLKKVAIGAAAAGAGAVALGNRPASAALGTFADATTVSDVTYTGPTLTTQSAVTVHDGVNATVLPLFPAAVGGYGSSVKVANGVHGSTTLPAGYGVVAANTAATATGSDVTAALAIASLGAHARFITPLAVATAAGVSPLPAKVVGPAAGDYKGGELYVDDDYNLWFFVKSGTTVRPVHLAGPSVSGAFHALTPRPIRVLDTRTGGGSKVASGANPTVALDTALTGLGALAKAVVLNLTVTETVGSGFHTAYATGTPLADIKNPDGTIAFSNINWDGVDQNRANLAIVPVGVTGTGSSAKPAVSLIAGGGGSTHAVVDVVGYYL
jgi:hypothetical protein